MIALCNVLIAYIIGQYLTVQQWWLVFILILINNFCVMTYGMAQGMLMISITQTAFRKWLDAQAKENKKKKNKSDTK